MENTCFKIRAIDEQIVADTEFYWGSDGKLYPAGEKTFNYTSARLTTSGKQSFQYGKIEARMKLPALNGLWPAFWMMGYNDKGWPYCGEIDILESWNDVHFAQGAWHWFNDDAPSGYELWRMYTAQRMDATAYIRDDRNWNTDVKGWKNFDKTQWHN